MLLKSKILESPEWRRFYRDKSHFELYRDLMAPGRTYSPRVIKNVKSSDDAKLSLLTFFVDNALANLFLKSWKEKHELKREENQQKIVEAQRVYREDRDKFLGKVIFCYETIENTVMAEHYSTTLQWLHDLFVKLDQHPHMVEFAENNVESISRRDVLNRIMDLSNFLAKQGISCGNDRRSHFHPTSANAIAG